MDKAPVKVATHKQNVYKVDGNRFAVAPKVQSKNKTYLSLEKRYLDNGLVEELIEKDYPITEESVSSLAIGADYHNDPAQAVARAPQRVNLGDITQAQAFAENPQNYAKLFSDIKAYINQKTSELEKQAQVENVEEKGGKQE